MELYRSSLKGGAPNGRAACVLYGRVAAESQLVHPQTVQLAEAMLSKTVNIHPLGAQWKRAYSIMFNIFDLDVLKISAYRHGLTLRTRMVNAPGAGKCIIRCGPASTDKNLAVIGTALDGNTQNVVDPTAMPSYLSQLQLTANDESKQ